MTSPTGQGEIKIGKGSNSLAESQANSLGLTISSRVRTDADVKRGIGYSGDDHHKGTALDVAGSVAAMDKYAEWAKSSGKFTKVIYKGRNLMTGTKVPGHDDHVHISWG